MQNVTVNTDQRLYVIPCGGGYTCHGFDVVENELGNVGDWLAQHGERSPWATHPNATAQIGTPERYAFYRAVMEQAARFCERFGKRCEVSLTPQLVGLEGRCVEVVDKYGEKRRFQVGKSTGWMPIHLEVARRTPSGGGAVTGAPFQSVNIIR